ncbi:MAG: hypothetical protein ACLQFR_30650 [Streptosporangiaceae bacterium]
MAKQVGPATAGSVGSTGAGYGASAAAGAGTGTGHEVIPFVSQVPGTPVTFASFHGRTVSWVAVSVIMAAFLIGGLSLVFGPTWWLFWVSLAIAAVGGLMALSIGIFDDWY